MKNNLFFFTDNIFLEKDFTRFEIFKLSKNFNIKIFLVNNKTNFDSKKFSRYCVLIENLSDLKKEIYFIKNFFVIDLMGINFKCLFIRYLLKKKEAKLIKLYLNISPFSKTKKKFSYFLSTLFSNNFKVIIRKIFIKPLVIFNNFFIYDYVFYAGKIGKDLSSRISKKKIISYHSFDYNSFLKNTKNYANNYRKTKKDQITFVDNNLLYHPDYKYHSANAPVTKDYYKILNKFLDFIENKFNINLLVALNPKSDFHLVKKLYPNRRMYINQTHKLIAKSKAVILHQSTTLGLAIILKKPVIFITTNELNKSWYKNLIYEQARILSCKVFNIDSKNDVNLIDLDNLKYPKELYKKYFINYVCDSHKKKIIFSDFLIKQLA
jgi:hypothetical protein